MLTLFATKVVITIVSIFAELATCFRLSYRWRSGRFWFDDAWAGISLVCSIIGLSGFWINITGTTSAKVTWWLRSLMLVFVVWSARMSILYSMIRIVPPSVRLRKYTYGLAAFFSVMWIAQIVQNSVLCAADKSWQTLDFPRCTPASSAAIFEICTDIVSDILLIGLPMRILWSIDIAPFQKKLLIVLLPASLAVTLISVIHIFSVLSKADSLVQDLTASLEASIASMVANLAVFYTSFRPLSDPDSSSGSQASLRDDVGMRKLGKHISVRPNHSISGFGPEFREQEFGEHLKSNQVKISLPVKLASKNPKEVKKEANLSFYSKGDLAV